MEVPVELFFAFWYFIGPAFLILGFYVIDKTELSNSVSPLVMSLFKHFLETSMAFSMLLSGIRLNQWKNEKRKSHFWIRLGVYSALIQITGSWIRTPSLFYLIKVVWLNSLIQVLLTKKILTLRYPLILTICSTPALIFPQYIIMILHLINLLVIGREFYINPPQDTRLAFQMGVETSLLLTCPWNDRFLELELSFVSIYVVYLICAIEPVRGVRIDSVVSALVAKVKEKKMVNFVEFAVGMCGAVLFQNFFRLTSFNQVLAFLCLAVAWLANLALLHASYDFGVFNFLLGNVVVGCTVNQFGLRGTTWLSYAAALFLYGLRLKLETLTLVYYLDE